MLKRTAFLVLLLWLVTATVLPGCGEDKNNDALLLLLANSCSLSGTITDLSGTAVNGTVLKLYIDANNNILDGTTASYTLTWNGGTGVGNSMNYSVNVKDVTAGPYYLIITDSNAIGLNGISNDPPTSSGGNPVTVNIDCGTTWNLSMSVVG